MGASLPGSPSVFGLLQVNIEEARKILKRHSHGPQVLEALRFRLALQLADPKKDPMMNQVWDAYKVLPSMIKTPCSILDAGCMSGFLYHYLKKRINDFTYTGVDRWEEALQVGREYAPELDFRRGDLETDYFGQFDYVICSNIPWQAGNKQAAFENLLMQAKTLIFIHPLNVVEKFERATGNTPDA